MSGPIASTSSFAPIAAAFFICSTLMFTTSNSAWVTTTRSQPASRAASTIASTSVGEGHVVLEDDGLHLAGHVELRHLVVVHRPPEDVRGAVVVEVDQPLDRADGRGRGREDADLCGCLRRQAPERGQAGDAGGRGLEKVATAPAVRRALGRVRRRRVSPAVTAAVGEPPSGERERLHGTPPRSAPPQGAGRAATTRDLT